MTPRVGPPIIELTMRASLVARILTLALEGKRLSVIAGKTKKSQPRIQAVLAAHDWPDREATRAMRDQLLRFKDKEVTFDVEPFHDPKPVEQGEAAA